MTRPCSIVFYGFLALYALALILLLIGRFGLFGSERDPLSGVFLVPLGLPWNRLTGWAPASLLPWLAAAAPLVNLVLIRLICRWIAGRA
jgi:hypothetical protein